MIDLNKTIDLSTTYLGLKLKSPLMASCSPHGGRVGYAKQMGQVGADALELNIYYIPAGPDRTGELRLHNEGHRRAPDEGALGGRKDHAARLPLILSKRGAAMSERDGLRSGDCILN